MELKIEEVFSEERMRAFTSVMCNLHEYSLKNDIPKDLTDLLNDPNMKNFVSVSKHLGPVIDGKNSTLASFMTSMIVKSVLKDAERGKLNEDLRFFINKRFKKQFLSQIRYIITRQTNKMFVKLAENFSKTDGTQGQNNDDGNSSGAPQGSSSKISTNKINQNNSSPIDKTAKTLNSDKETKNAHQMNSYSKISSADELETSLILEKILQPSSDCKPLFSHIDISNFDPRIDVNYQELEKQISDELENSNRLTDLMTKINIKDICLKKQLYTQNNIKNNNNIKNRNEQIKLQAAEVLYNIRLENQQKKETTNKIYKNQSKSRNIEEKQFYIKEIASKLSLEMAKKILKRCEEHDVQQSTVWDSVTNTIKGYFIYMPYDLSIPNIATKSFAEDVKFSLFTTEILKQYDCAAQSQFFLLRKNKQITEGEIDLQDENFESNISIIVENLEQCSYTMPP